MLVGHQPLIGLSGQRRRVRACLRAGAAELAVAVPSVLAFATLGVLVSVATRNSLAGVVGPTVVGLALQLLLLVGGLGPVPAVLPNA